MQHLLSSLGLGIVCLGLVACSSNGADTKVDAEKGSESGVAADGSPARGVSDALASNSDGASQTGSTDGSVDMSPNPDSSLPSDALGKKDGPVDMGPSSDSSFPGDALGINDSPIDASFGDAPPLHNDALARNDTDSGKDGVAKKLNFESCASDEDCLSGSCKQTGDSPTSKACWQACTTVGSTTECQAGEKCQAADEPGRRNLCAPTCTVARDQNCLFRSDELVNCSQGFCADQG